MKAKNVFKRVVSCGAIVLAIMGGAAIAATTVEHNNTEKVEATVNEATYPTAGIVRQISIEMKESGTDKINIKKHDVDVVQSAYQNEEDTSNDISFPEEPDDEITEMENLREENVQLQETINHMEKTIAQYKEDNDALVQKNKKLQKELEDYAEKERQREALSSPVAKLNPSDVRELSGSSPETLNILLEGTWLEGYGQKFYDNEQQYGVNALFSIGNAILETGWDGDNWLAKHRNNIYGINTSTAFDSYNDCIDYWFRLISNNYVGEGYISMSSIQRKYCPPNTSWDEQIISVTRRLRNKAGITIE